MSQTNTDCKYTPMTVVESFIQLLYKGESQESLADRVKRRFLRSFNSLPERVPYGFWLSPQGRLVLVDRFQHKPFALDYIHAFYPDVLEDGNVSLTVAYQVSMVMFRKGWFKGVADRSNSTLFVSGNGTMSHKQSQMAEDFASNYKLKRVKYTNSIK